MIAYGMNGEQLPLLNGFPLRLIVPGWYATYWVKMLNDIEVLRSAGPQTTGRKSPTLFPTCSHASIEPGQTNVRMTSINRMVPRSFVTNQTSGSAVKSERL